MLSVSRSSSYAIVALSRLADATDTWTLASELCAETGIPGPYLSKILHLLGKSGLIKTKRGYRGGFMLARSPSAISVLEVVEAVEGPDCLGECLLGQAICEDDRACPTHEFWKTERERIRELLAELTLESVAEFERTRVATRATERFDDEQLPVVETKQGGSKERSVRGATQTKPPRR